VDPKPPLSPDQSRFFLNPFTTDCPPRRNVHRPHLYRIYDQDRYLWAISPLSISQPTSPVNTSQNEGLTMDTFSHAHPYYPSHADIPGYVPNDTPLTTLLLAFATIAGGIIIATYAAAARQRLPALDRFAACWFALSGFLHVAFESYYILHRTTMASKNTLFAQLWKEYTLSDSRYLTSDVFTVCVETITVLAWGPLSILAVLCILRKSHHRHFYQIVVCIAHLYGVALYYATNWAEARFSGASYSRPEFLYYWVYYVGFNLPWAVVPLVLLYDSFCQLERAFATLHEQETRRKAA
jgi:cholestenol delta-isomerase